MGHRALSALAIGWLLAASNVAAAPPRALHVEVRVCPGVPLDAREVARAVRTELDADGEVRTTEYSDGSDGTLSATIGCDREMTALLRLEATNTGRASQRSIVLADAAETARTGVVALLASELVRANWATLSETPSVALYPAEPIAVPEPSAAPALALALAPALATAAPPNVPTTDEIAAQEQTREQAASTRNTWSIAGGLRLRWFPDYASTGWGADAGADRGAWRLRGETLITVSEDALGSARMGSAAACVGYRVLQAKLARFLISSYPMAALGVTWMRGTSKDSTVLVTPSTGPYADLRLVTEARLVGGGFTPTFAAELGRATGLVARSNSNVLGATGGFFIGASAGARY